MRRRLRVLFCTTVLLPACGDAEPGSRPASGPAVASTAGHALLPADLSGHWFVNRDGERLTLTLPVRQGVRTPAGTSLVESAGGTSQPIRGLEADALGVVQFHVPEPSGTAWYRTRVANGVLMGRVARTAGSPPRWPADFQGRVTGWRQETFDADSVPRVWDVALPGGRRAVLRIDRPAPDARAFIGTLKPYALQGQLAESPAEEVDVQAWDGQNLTFVRRAATPLETYQGTASGRTIAGLSQVDGGGAAMPWNGTRAEVLTHGFGARTAPEVAGWQAATRERLALLLMGGNPRPVSAQVSELGSRDPIADDGDQNPDRDDDQADWPQNYKLTELSFETRIPSVLDGDQVVRHAHGYVAVPAGPPPPGGYPVALALNGHGGSAYDTFGPGWMYWYGDSFARRGFLVISVDVGHRPLADRASIYQDALDGDDPGSGNGTHPAVASPGLSSDWEEDGERAWDAMRALDYALGRADVNRQDVTAVGLSMGGEITDWVAALDTRIGTAVAAGDPSDLAVMSLHGNHPCWMWQRGDAREYYDPGDLHALVASRTLVRETGKQDTIYSDATPPFRIAKEVVWRAAPAFQAMGGRLVHFMHFDAHDFQVGQFCLAEGAADGVTVPTVGAPDPANPWSTDWSGDGTTTPLLPSIFAAVPGGG